MSNKQTNFWYYTRKERHATILLMALVVLVFLLPALYRLMVPTTSSKDQVTLLLEAISQFEQAPLDSLQTPVQASLFNFDPNTATRSDFLALGLSTRCINTIIKYRNKVGTFKQASDFSKIYTLPKSDYQRLLPFIKIAKRTTQKNKIRPEANKEVVLHTFNPNHVERSALKQFGLPDQVIRNWLRYLEKGGQFQRAEDLQKIYGLREDDFNRIRPYLSIPTPEKIPQEEFNDSLDAPITRAIAYQAPKTQVRVDINHATVEEWQQLYGIGPSYSQRIVKFRDKLGGFHRIAQVAETFGLPDSTFQKIKPYLDITTGPETIAINVVDATVLQQHPYIRWKEANIIMAYRKEHGPFASLDDLKKVRALSADLILKLSPYLKFDYHNDQ
ncbi:MAG: helix-hairpin-helix domain-containing protein [Saprospiraceae bacterium]|nr:helix-hairpin-helix domain-containing protein [Saprospiraceae bacterium]